MYLHLRPLSVPNPNFFSFFAELINVVWVLGLFGVGFFFWTTLSASIRLPFSLIVSTILLPGDSRSRGDARGITVDIVMRLCSVLCK